MRSHGTNRREFLAVTGMGALGLASAAPLAGAKAAELPDQKFYMLLSCDRIGVKASFRESLDLAVKYGFEGVDPDAEYFSRLSDGELRGLLEEVKSKNLKLGAAGLPVEFRKDDEPSARDSRSCRRWRRASRRRGAAAWAPGFSLSTTS